MIAAPERRGGRREDEGHAQHIRGWAVGGSALWGREGRSGQARAGL